MENTDSPPFDLDGYLARIGLKGEAGLGPDLETLERLHLGHSVHIPFENLDIHLGRPIRLDLASLERKLVAGRRGGYCFEHNTLFATALERLGFPVARLAARVRLGATRITPRTHMLLAVTVEGAPWIADVGFGGEGPLRPLLLMAEQPSVQFGRPYRLVESGGLWVLQLERDGHWADLYAFTLEPHHEIDYVMASHYTSTFPESPFVRTLTAQARSPERRAILRNRELEIRRGSETIVRTIESDDDLLEVLSTTFGLDLPAGTRFRSPALALAPAHQSTTEPSSAS
jgi:N-hydroxyarylamine O-acetyltransferase